MVKKPDGEYGPKGGKSVPTDVIHIDADLAKLERAEAVF